MSELVKVGGIQPFTLIDFPNRIAAVIFLQGCNLRCRFCYNSSLLAKEAEYETQPTFEETIRFLNSRKGFLDGVVFSGGEPCIHKGLLQAIDIVKNLGYEVCLHTNGFFPKVVKQAINQNLLDFVAVDFKAPFYKYKDICGVSINESEYSDLADFIVSSGIEYEYRTTVQPDLLNEKDLIDMSGWLKEHRIKTYAVQEFVHGNALDKKLKSSLGRIWLTEKAADSFNNSVENFIIREENRINALKIAA